MRGKDRVKRQIHRCTRITPAYAGKSEMKSSPISSPIGSPPPMRGKVGGDGLETGNVRITPAYAGKSFGLDIAAAAVWDHPRLCGEKSPPTFSTYFLKGSPPPMRGKVKATPPHTHEPRITPAYAGKSFDMPTSHTGYRDHPRLCGEKPRSSSSQKHM